MANYATEIRPSSPGREPARITFEMIRDTLMACAEASDGDRRARQEDVSRLGRRLNLQRDTDEISERRWNGRNILKLVQEFRPRAATQGWSYDLDHIEVAARRLFEPR